jgi:hypothetical protein
MAHGTLIHGLVDFLLGVTDHLRPEKIATNSIYVEHRNFLTMRNKIKNAQSPISVKKKREKLAKSGT